jgi:hypothetical protein
VFDIKMVASRSGLSVQKAQKAQKGQNGRCPAGLPGTQKLCALTLHIDTVMQPGNRFLAPDQFPFC